MKGKQVSIVTNAVLLLVIAATSVVGFLSGSSVAVSSAGTNLYYSTESKTEIALMFNVYQNTENVYNILNILDEYQAKATFFVGGSWADDNVDCVREIYNRGHEIASHGYFHKDHSEMNYDQNVKEISPSVKLLNMICNTQINLFAPPSGAYNDATLQACAKLGLNVIMWSRDTIDWRDSDENLIYTRATENLQGGEFILMHPMDVSVAALPEILNYIGNCGLKTQTISKMIGE